MAEAAGNLLIFGMLIPLIKSRPVLLELARALRDPESRYYASQVLQAHGESLPASVKREMAAALADGDEHETMKYVQTAVEACSRKK